MKRSFSTLFIIISILSACTLEPDSKRPFLNLGFEYSVPDNDIPLRWNMWNPEYDFKLVDRREESGKCFKIESKHLYSKEFRFFGTLPLDLVLGKEVELRGKIRVHSVNDGFSGLWCSVSQCDSTLFFDDMKDRGIKGTTDWQLVSLKVNVDTQATDINFGGILSGSGTAWFDDFEIFIDGIKLIESDPSVLEPKKEEISSLQKYIHPLETLDPDVKSNNDLEVLDKMIQHAKVIGLGESSHGTSEIFQMKHRIIRYLAEKHGFDIFSIEANMPEACEINNYIKGLGSQEINPIKNMYYGVWSTHEVRNMIEWMKTYNSAVDRMQFTGFDMQFCDESVKVLESAFIRNKNVKSHIKELKNKLTERKDYTKPLSEEESKLIKEKINIKLSLIREGIDQSSMDTKKKAWLHQNIRILEQYLNLSPAKRDEFMAENLLWIKDQNPQSKIAVWAHNGHIKKSGYSMGSHLSKALDEEYLSIGFAFYHGKHTAATGVNYTLSGQKSKEAYPGTYEYLFNAIEEPLFILDLREAKKDSSMNGKWLSGDMEFRNAGLTKQKCEFFRTYLVDDFDLIIFIKESTPTKLLSPSE